MRHEESCCPSPTVTNAHPTATTCIEMCVQCILIYDRALLHDRALLNTCRSARPLRPARNYSLAEIVAANYVQG